MVLRIISINARGLADVLKKRIIFNYYKDRADMICLQETHSKAEDELIWASEFGAKALFSHGTTQSTGVCILIKKTVPYRMVRIVKGESGRYIIIELENLDDPTKRFCLCNLYAPNKDSPSFFAILFKDLFLYAPDKIVIGDFNLVMDPQKDRRGSIFNHNQSCQLLK